MFEYNEISFERAQIKLDKQTNKFIHVSSDSSAENCIWNWVSKMDALQERVQGQQRINAQIGMKFCIFVCGS